MAQNKKLPKPTNKKSNRSKNQKNDEFLTELSEIITKIVDPLTDAIGKTVTDSFKVAGSYLVAELPELDYLSGFVKDLSKQFLGKNVVKKEINIAHEQAKDIKVIKKETTDHTDLFDKLADEFENIIDEIKSLTEVTSNVWGIEKDQLDEIKQQTKDQRQSEKDRKFQQQKEKSKIIGLDKKFDLKDVFPKKSLFEKFLSGAGLLGIISKFAESLAGLFENIAIAVLGKSIGSKLVGPLTKGLKSLKVPSKANLTKGFGRVAEESIKKASKLGKFAKDGAKLGGKYFGIASLAMTGISAGQNTFNGYKEGKRGADLLYRMLSGLINDFFEPYLDIFKVKDKDFAHIDKMKKLFDDYQWAIGNEYDDIVNLHKKVFNTMKDSVLDITKNMSDTVKYWKDVIVGNFTQSIREILQEIIPETNKINILGHDVKFVPDPDLNPSPKNDLKTISIREVLQKIIPETNKVNILGHDVKFVPDDVYKFTYPEKQSQQPDLNPSPKNDLKTIEMLSNQQQIEKQQDEALKKQSGAMNNSGNVINNVQPVNNTILAAPIVTRNPDPILFGSFVGF